MAAASQNVRTALFGMEKLNQKMKTTQASLNQATEDLQAAQQQQQEANDALDQSRKDVETLKAQQQELEAESQRRTTSSGSRTAHFLLPTPHCRARIRC